MPHPRTAGVAALVLTLAAGAVSAQAKPQGAPATKPAMSVGDEVIAHEKAIYDALTKNDINGSVAIAAMGGLTTCIGLLLADIVVALLDPRIRVS